MLGNIMMAAKRPIPHVVAIITLLFVGCDATPQANPDKAGFDANRYAKARKLVGYTQPDGLLLEAISKTYGKDFQGAEIPPELQNIPAEVGKLKFCIVEGVPFFRYSQDEVERYLFHPMAYGRIISHLAGNDQREYYINALMRTGLALKNGGILWYYPNNYNLNRMNGPDLKPSAIGQGQILGGLVDVVRASGDQFRDELERAFLGLSYDYFQGGVNLENLALLEIPLFRSAPEIVLNGWLHALIHLKSYSDLTQDPRADPLIHGNIGFLALSLAFFHDERTQLSLYSTLTPYRVRIDFPEDFKGSLEACYQSRLDLFPDVRVPIQEIGGDRFSPYDNQIITRRNRVLYIWINSSSMYDTFILSDREPEKATFRTGVYDPRRATPDEGGDEILVHPVRQSEYFVLDITQYRDRMFCGYPTNFAKAPNLNYYHPYHVVALSYILATFPLTPSQYAQIREWTVRWHDRIGKGETPPGMKFMSYEDLLSGIAGNHKALEITDWSILWDRAMNRKF